MNKLPKGGNLSNKFNEILAKRKLARQVELVTEAATENAIKEVRAMYDPAVRNALFQVLDIKSRFKDHKRVPVFLVLAVCCFFAVIFQLPANDFLEIILAFEFCLVASVLTQDAVSWNTKFEEDRVALVQNENLLKKFGF
jgi:hypothetical protein